MKKNRVSATASVKSQTARSSTDDDPSPSARNSASPTHADSKLERQSVTIKRSAALLAVSSVLLALWFAFLVWLAWHSA